MYYGSDEFNSIIDSTQGSNVSVRLKFAEDEILETMSICKFYGGSNDTDDITVGTTMTQYVDATVFTDKLLGNREFLLEASVKLSDGTYEYAPIGYFTVKSPKGDNDEVSFVAYDRMIKFEKVYSSALTYPTDSEVILNELCALCGVELATTIDTPITITENLQGYTCREVLGYIAGIHGYFACFDRFGKLNLRWYEENAIEKTLKYIWSFDKSQDLHTIGKVEVAKNSETTYTSGDGITTLHHSNPYATQEIVDGLFAKLNGYSYNSGEIDMLDDIRLDPWDVVKVEYYDNVVYHFPLMSIQHDFGASNTVIKAFARDVESEYRFTGPTIKYLNRVASDMLIANRVLATKVDAEYVNSHAITTENFEAKVAEIKELVVEEIDGKYANIDLANIDIANIGDFYARSGILDEVLIKDGAVTGVLKGVRIVGDVIEANTIKADSLILSGSDESLIYQINVTASGLTAEQLSDDIYKEKLSGTDLVAESVTTNELAANCITASKIKSGEITADKMNVTSLSAISANLGKVTAGIIESNNYVVDEEGLQINLNDGTWNGKYFKIDENGKMVATAGNIGNWDINDEGLYFKNNAFEISITPPTATGDFINIKMTDEGEYMGSSSWSFDGRGQGRIYTHSYSGVSANISQIEGDTIRTTAGADLDTINSNLSSGIKVDYKYLSYSDTTLNQQGTLVTTTKTSYTTQFDSITNAHRKFSDYQYLCFELLINSNYVRATMTIPRDRFTEQGFVVELFYVDSINTQRWVDIIYKSDTSFYMIGSSNIVANTRVSITGLIAKY